MYKMIQMIYLLKSKMYCNFHKYLFSNICHGKRKGDALYMTEIRNNFK